MPGFLVVQQHREYRKHQIEITDHGKTGCAVVVRPPPSVGEAWAVPRDSAAVTLAELLTRAKAQIDAAMGPRPPQRFQHEVRWGR